MSKPSLKTTDLTINFGGHVAVNRISLEFYPGELTVIVGPNGAGKTTYFNLISGQLNASEGLVEKDGIDITKLSPSQRAHNGIGRAFQLTNLFPHLTVLENVRLATQANSGDGWHFFRSVSGFNELISKASIYLKATKLTNFASMTSASLSHGDQRKLEVAMLMAMEPDIYMFDEPTAGMGMDHTPFVLELIANLKKDKSKTILLVEHKMEVVKALADRIVVLHNGELVADGQPTEVMNSQIVADVYLGTTGINKQ